jgi:diguanylate cyclase (GGDEF)-like protein
MKYSKDGQPHWLDMNIMPLRNKDGVIEHYASIERDLTRYKKMERQLANMALFDSLTGALSRGAFEQHAEKEFKRAQRYSRPLSVIMVDIDHFKNINDAYGHAAGDHVLQIFVEAIEEEIRSTDAIGRIGGEEFALLLPDTTKNAAGYLAERVRQRITKYPYIAGKMLIEVTASLGVAVIDSADTSFKAMLERADEALYAAKHAGRNRVTMAA